MSHRHGNTLKVDRRSVSWAAGQQRRVEAEKLQSTGLESDCGSCLICQDDADGATEKTKINILTTYMYTVSPCNTS